MNVLELYAGSRSIGKVAERMGANVFSCDINAFDGIDYVGDVLEFDYSRLPFVPNIIWASPPCTGFSVAAIGHHWTGGHRAYVPKTETAKLGIKLLDKTIEIIDAFPDAVFWIENPRGLMRKMDVLQRFFRHSISYCQYGDTRMKPTDIWTNCTTWMPRPMCKNGDPCHEAAPRGSRTGTQGLKDNYERSKIPEELCREVMEASFRQVKKGMMI